MDKHKIGPALGRIPSGIFIVTAKRGPDETGMLASWVQQAGFEPPMITLAVKKGRYVADWLAEGHAWKRRKQEDKDPKRDALREVSHA